MILTDGQGHPIPRPDPPPREAPIETWIAYLRDFARYKDRISDIASAAFDAGFREAMRTSKNKTD